MSTSTPARFVGSVVASSSTGKMHRAYVRGDGIRRTATANCATDFRYGSRAVYLRGIHEATEADMESGDLCGKCFA